jgi:hypothetical protein
VTRADDFSATGLLKGTRRQGKYAKSRGGRLSLDELWRKLNGLGLHC